MAIGAVVARIITQYSDKGSKQAKKDIQKLGDSFDNFSKTAVRAFAVATAAVSAFAVKIGKDAVQAAIADQKAQALLANSLRNTTGATNAAIASVEQYIGKLQLQVGVADDELRPALARLAAATGSVASAQQLLGTALDVSAFSGASLESATRAVTKALQGSFKGLQTLVPGISATAVKSKDLVAVFKQVQDITSGAAATRADTLEYRLAILRIRYGEILETLGYQLLPVIEKFAKTIQSKVLPQVEAWVAVNGEKLVLAFEFASQAAIKLLQAAIAFSGWIANNMGLVKTMAAIIGTMFVVGKIAAFATAIQTLATAFTTLRTAAAGAAIATAFATGGTSVIAATAALAAVGGAAAIYAGLKGAGNKVRSDRAKALAGSSSSVAERGRSAVRASRTRTSTVTGNGGSIFDSLLNAQNALNSAKKKELSIEQQIINKMLRKYGLTLMTAEAEAKATAEAIKRNLNRQQRIANSPTVNLATQGDGSTTGNVLSGAGTPQVTVNITTPHGTAEDYVVTLNNSLNTLARRQGLPPRFATRME